MKCNAGRATGQRRSPQKTPEKRSQTLTNLFNSNRRGLSRNERELRKIIEKNCRGLFAFQAAQSKNEKR